MVYFALHASVASSQEQRGLQVDDLMKLEQLGSVAVSPNGEWLAVVVVRAMTESETYRDFPFDYDRADVWIVSRRGEARRNITNGAVDGSGYWNPVWSPDGKHLALLSTQRGGHIRPYVWDMVTGSLRRLTERDADLLAYGDAGFPNYAMIWSDNQTLLCPILPEGAPPSYFLLTKARSLSEAVRGWVAAERGLEATANVLESGSEGAGSRRPKGQLLAIDIVSRASRVVAEGNFRLLLLSPTRHHLAVISEIGRIPPRPERSLPYYRGSRDELNDLWRTQLGIIALGSEPSVTWVDGVHDCKVLSYTPQQPHAWSPDGSAFAVIAKETRDEKTAVSLFIVSATTGTAHLATKQRFEVMSATWSRAGDLLAYALPRFKIANVTGPATFGWWRIDLGRTHAPVQMAVPSTLVSPMLSPLDRHTMLGVAAGDLWSFDVSAMSLKNLTSGFGLKIESIWPSEGTEGATPWPLVVTGGDGEIYRLIRNGPRVSLVLLPRPSKRSSLAAYVPQQRLAVFTAKQSNGVFVWTSDDFTGHFRQVVALNSLLEHIADSKRLLIRYVGSDGDTLNSVLLLPVRYEKGRRYPLITYVYAGMVFTDTTLGDRFEKYLVSSMNMNLLPAHGFAVLLPSMPLVPNGQVGDPMIDLPKGVMAAVDRVIELGFADPERLGVMGHSFGGYSTYALVAYTHRFKAAVAMAGPSDLMSFYGTFSTPSRYAKNAHEELFAPALSESGQIHMGSTPWSDLWRYVRNSPLYFVDRIQTPLMIIHGDIDYVPIEQAEELFTALYRSGKRATFIRYTGEGHVISSPANIRDVWQRIFVWFDQNLGYKAVRPGRVASTTSKSN